MSSLPNKPWNEGDKFTNDATGVEYTFDGVKWLASGGEELDLSEIEARLEELESHHPDPVPLEGTLRWVDYTYTSDTIDALVAQIRVHPDRTKMSLNWDTINDGRKDWGNLINDSVGLEVDGTMYWANVEYIGGAGQSGRGKNFNILQHNIPPAGEISENTVTGIYPNYKVGDGYATTEYVDDAIAAIPSELDDRYLQLTGGALKANARINVDQIEPVDPERYIRYEAGRDKRYPFALANFGMVQDYVAEELEKIPAPEIIKSRISTQVRTMFSTQAAQGKASFIDGDGNRLVRPDSGLGIEYTIARDWSGYKGDKDWWRDDYEPLDTGYIQVIDPFTGKIKWAAGVNEVTRTGDTIRWMISGSIYTNYPDWDANMDYFLNLNGCLREK